MTKKINFTHRRKARKIALQALYAWYISGNFVKDVESDTLEHTKDSKYDIEYFLELFHQVIDKQETLEEALKPYLARPAEELDPIERMLLNMAAYEMLERLDIPYKVVINEAVDLAKSFGATESHKFVNGVLDKLAKAHREVETQAKGG